MNLSVSVVIATYNRSEKLRTCLLSLRALGASDTLEVIVVDDGSTDNTKAALAEMRKTHSGLLVLSQKNRGQARARNYGAQNANGDVVAFTDDDCTVLPGWIDQIRKSMADPENLAVEGPVIGQEADEEIHPLCRVLHNPGPKAFLTSNLAVRRSIFLAENGFDERMRMHEDTDLCLRLLRKGKIAYNPEMRIRHPQEKILWWKESLFSERYARRYVFSEYLLYCKNPDAYPWVRYHSTFYQTFFHYSLKYAYYFCKMPTRVIRKYPWAYFGRWIYCLKRQFFIALWFAFVCLFCPRPRKPSCSGH